MHPEWSYSSNIYEVNIRQYTEEGTFRAFEEHLPRLREMGVEILWFMPLTPISKRDRKGTLGSYYAVKDYCAINPEFGNANDFSRLVRKAHELGFKLIIDWVANHTGNDHNWLYEHPEYYERDEDGEVVHPNDWSDVSHLSFEQEGTRAAMIGAMKFWITEFNIDGFRCDMAHLVPLDFWYRAHGELEQVKGGLFWLGECEEATYHNAFDATYTWDWMHASEKLYKKEINLTAMADLLESYRANFPPDAFRVYFTSNHDENSWNGTEYEKFREMALPFAIFSCTWNGLPMLYSGQELPNYKRLAFFDKDQINWNGKPALHDFYRALLSAKKRNPALLAGSASSTEWLNFVEEGDGHFAYKRKNGDDEVLVILNFSPLDLRVETMNAGQFTDIFTGEKISLSGKGELELGPWGYKVLEKMKA